MMQARFDGLIVEILKILEPLPDDPALLFGSALFIVLLLIVFIYVSSMYWWSLSG